METVPDPIAALYRRPGFMLRRAHQIAVSVFLEATADLHITTTQYGMLVLLSQHEGLDQAGAARLLGLDRSTTALVAKKLEARGLLTRGHDWHDRRRHSLSLTEAGHVMLARLAGPAQQALTDLMAPLNEDEQASLMALLAKLTAAFNATARVKLVTDVPAD